MVFQDLLTSLSVISSEISDGEGDWFDFSILDQSLSIMVRISATSEIVAERSIAISRSSNIDSWQGSGLSFFIKNYIKNSKSQYF